MTFTNRTLGEICDEVGGTVRTGPFGSQLHQSDYSVEGTPIVMPKDIVGDKISIDDIARVGPEHTERLSQHKLLLGDIVYGRRGDIGRRAIVTEKEQGWLCGTGSLRISLGFTNPVLDPLFLYYYLGQPEIIEWIYNQAIGATMPNLNTSIIRSIPIAYPPLETQRRIAAVLSAYDDLIENNTQRIKALEAAAQALYREWFVEFRFPGHESVEWVESELGRIPKGWEWVTLADLVESPRDSVQPDEVDPVTPYVGLAHIPQKSIALYQWGEASETVSTKLVFKKGDILFAKIRPYLHKVAVAPLNGVCSSDTIIIRPIHPEIYGLVLQTVFSDEFVGHADTTSQGTNMPRANWDVLVQYPIPLPPNGLLGHFNSLVQDSIELIDNMIFRNRTLRNARDLLLPRLISGELSVEQVPLPDDLDLTGR